MGAELGRVDARVERPVAAARTRWAWRFPIRPLAAVADLHDAPAVEEAGVFPQSVWRHSHIRLTREQFETARRLIEAVGSRG